MQFYLIGGLLFSFFVAIFALWNSTEIIIRFPFLGEFTTSQALVIIGSATLGALITMIFSLVKHVKLNLQIKKHMKTIREHEEIIDKMKKQIEENQVKEESDIESTQSLEVPADPLQ
ncbi:MAG: LapA family protein [Tepidanaerobacteraceae bacterium]|nr:LapA family protein [Tepidanaerobacteraceae bacterium]